MAVKGRMAYFSECKVEQEPLGEKGPTLSRTETAFLLFPSLLFASCTVLFAKLPVFLTEIYSTITDWRVTLKIKEKDLNPRLEV